MITEDKISIVIVDDHEITRLGIRQILEKAEDIEVVGEADNGNDAFALVQRLHPKVLLLDIQMPGMPAREIERLVRIHYPDVITLILTGHDRDAYLADFMKLGVSGYFDKNVEGGNLIAAIYRAVKGESLFTIEQYKRAQDWNTNVGTIWENLTPREKEICNLLAQGFDDQRIAKKLSISRRTVYFHIENILEKLKVETRLQVIAWMNKNVPSNLRKFTGKNLSISTGYKSH